MKKLTIKTTFLCLMLAFTSQAQLSVVNDLKEELKTATSDTARMRVHYELARHFQQQTPDEVIEHADEAIKLARENDDFAIELKASYAKSIGLYLSGKNQAASNLLDSILQAPKYPEDDDFLINTYNLKGSVENSLEHYENAVSYYVKSLEISRPKKDTSSILTSLANLGSLHFSYLDKKKGLTYTNQAIEMAKQINDRLTLASLYQGLSVFVEDPEEKLDYAMRAYQTFKEENYYSGIAYAANGLGSAFGELNRHREGIPYLHEARRTWEAAHFSQGLISVYTNLGVSHGNLGHLDSTAYFFQKALSHFRPGEELSERHEAYLNMAELYDTINRPDLAYTYLKQAYILKDSLADRQKVELQLDVEGRYEASEKERQLIEQDLIIARQRNTQRNVLAVAGGLILLLLGFFQYLRNRQRLRRREAEMALELEKTEAGKLRELDRLKSNFFANISHEFRTPLTLIQTPLGEALRTVGDQPNISLPTRYARSMQRNAQRLLHLVNQLLDLARLEGNRLRLEVSPGDIAHFIRSIGYGFESMALRKQMNYHVSVVTTPVQAWFDAEKLELILSNLLSNAFKFTPSEGRITLEAQFSQPGYVSIRVQDNGIGIPESQLPHIFDRFYTHSDEQADSVGSGIGLALTRELVHLHRGTIQVESEPDHGTVFSLHFPIDEESYTDSQKVATQPSGSMHLSSRGQQVLPNPPVDTEEHVSPLPSSSNKPRLLIVEDNPDLRRYIREKMQEEYEVQEAVNGKQGLQMAIDLVPDLIITDVMMPEMSGTELCTELRQEIATSHIPIIMLTAKAERDEKMAGLETGADEYLTKPFDTLELQVRSRNLIRQRQLLRERFAGEFVFKPSEVSVNSVDQDFLQKVLDTIENQLDDETFSVVELSQTMALSRSQLHRKLKALTNKSPNQIIRDMRLQRAHDLLEKKAGNASEVAFMVGFNSLAYFSKCFKDRFGKPPSEVEAIK